MKIVLFELDPLKFPHAKLGVDSLRLGVFLVNIQADTLGNGVSAGLGDHEIVQAAEYSFSTILWEDVGRLDPIDESAKLWGHLEGDQESTYCFAFSVFGDAISAISWVQNEVFAA